jgi:uroporphyrin-3 C-methyltransferase/uroporphyrinogen III methyltransferase/synthase
MDNASISSASVAQVPYPGSRSYAFNWLGLAALVAALIACLLWWVNHNRFEMVERELSRRIQTLETSGNESHVMAKQADDQVLALQTRIGVLESKLAESQSQQASLEQLYQDLSRTRDDWALAEVEQILAVASEELQLAGNVQGALIALQNADNRLARADRPQFIPLRRVIGHDMDRLRALPSVDLAGNALRIDSLVSMVDGLPLLSDERPIEAPRLDAQPLDRGGKLVTAKDGTQKSVEPGWIERIEDSWRYGTAEVWQELQQLIRIREVDQPEALLLTPSQSYFLKENLKLRLLNARLALLARQESIYRADLLRAEEMLQKYFDARARQTVVASGLLKQIEASNTSIELPTLSESLSAVRNFKTSRDH